MPLFGRKNNVETETNNLPNGDPYGDPLAALPKSRWERIWPAMACGSGLFSDGYINNVSRAVRLGGGDCAWN